MTFGYAQPAEVGEECRLKSNRSSACLVADARAGTPRRARLNDSERKPAPFRDRRRYRRHLHRYRLPRVRAAAGCTSSRCRRAGRPQRRRHPGHRRAPRALGRGRRRGRAASRTARPSPPTPCSSARAPASACSRPQGFRDVLEIGRQIAARRSTASSSIPRRRSSWRRAAIAGRSPERIDANGEVLMPLDEAAVATTAGRAGRGRRRGDRDRLPVLVPQSGARASRRASSSRARHPRLMRVALLRGRSGLPRIRAHGRHHLRRLREARVDRYLAHLEAGPRAGRHRGAAAGHAVARRPCESPTVARQRPVRLFLSGPGRRRDRRPDGGRVGRLPTTSSPIDVGGTSCDIALIEPAQADAALRRRDRRLCRCAWHGRRRPRSAPAAAAIAWLDAAGRPAGRPALGRLRAGPRLLRPRRSASRP